MSESSLQIAHVRDIDVGMLAAIHHLVPQLSASAPLPTLEQMREIAQSPSNTFLIARDTATGRLVGALTLICFRIPTGVRAWIEDVVVDQAERGRGIGSALIRESQRIALEKGALTVDLTSRPSREAANRLYQKLGFVRRDTNVYRFSPSDKHFLS